MTKMKSSVRRKLMDDATRQLVLCSYDLAIYESSHEPSMEDWTALAS